MKTIAIWARVGTTIGVDGDIPWKYSSDFKRFKNITAGHVVVCGRKTYETLPNRDLPGREIIVLTNDEKYEVSNETNHQVLCDYTLIQFSRFLWNSGGRKNLYIIGGSKVYDLFMTDPVRRPDYIVDCHITEKKVCDEINSIDDSKKTKLTSETMRILKEDYALLGFGEPQDSIQNSLYKKKSDLDRHLLDGITRVF